MVYIRSNESCNAACQMCGFAESDDSYSLSPDRLRPLVHELAPYGTKEIRFTGGEPLLNAHLVENVAIVASSGLRASVITNGMLLNNLIQPLLDAGLAGAICSLDSPDSEVHDELRQTVGIWKAATDALSRLAAQRHPGTIIAVNTVVSRLTYRDLPRLISLLDSLGVDYVRPIPIKDCTSLFLTPGDIHVYNAEIAPQVDSVLANHRISLAAISSRIFGETNSQIAAASKGRYPAHKSCAMTNTLAYLDAKHGSISACNCLPHRLGRPLCKTTIWKRPFLDTWLSESYVAERADFAAVAPEVCTGCEPANIKLNQVMAEPGSDLESVRWF